ncbi:MAG: hypothetical protein JSW41_04700 [Candidatus Aenigmatarchaeota archaeon]|nr:MAG: hypothetical protein JSW41_04700 [Candidatus Aenigmarchaeota archaeon]
MDFRKLLLLIPVVFVVLISGCTSPVCIPFLPFIPCDGAVEFPDDVVVIKSLDALPQTVSPGQQIKLIAYIQNVGKEPVPQTEGQSKLERIPQQNQKITVDLYDYCEGLFSEVKVKCGGGEKDCKNQPCLCDVTKLLPGQVKDVTWTLKAGDRDQVPLKTECDLKISVTYPYKTISMTDIHFIDYHEMQNRLNEGTFRSKVSYIVSGYGPVKPRITVEDEQPIPVQQGQNGRTVIALRIKNSGKGYLCRPNETKVTKVICDSKIPESYVKVDGIETGVGTKLYYTEGGSCAFKDFGQQALSGGDKFVTLINKESPPFICDIELRENVNLPKETTKHVTTKIEYMYEFRKELKIVIEPKT